MLRKEDVLGALQLLAAMYPLEGELELSEPASAALAAAESSEVYEAGGTTALDVVVRVTIEDESERALQVSITLPFDAPTSVAVRQPSWLPRAEFSALEDGLPRIDADEPASDAIMAAIEYVRSSGTLAAQAEDDKAEAAKAEGVLKAKEGSADTDPGSLCRVWLWLPGLETREKRRDLVVYAPTYALTGFVLAGKPGLICLEGGGKAVDRYMAVIKSESWGDVPSFQKKVTERLRRPLQPSERKFTEMTDITNIVPHYGRYNHRGDMSEVKRLMDDWGVGDDFGAAVMNMS